MSVLKKDTRSVAMSDNRKGQALVEFVLVLPFLLLLLIGLVELGYGFYDYMVMANANREGVRLGSRGRFEDQAVFQRILIAGGWKSGGNERILQTVGPDRNLGIILTHVPIEADGNMGAVTHRVTGTIALPDGSLGTINEDFSRVGEADIERYADEVAPLTKVINEYREDHEYEPQRNEIVIVETFVAHSMLFDFDAILPLTDPMSFYFRSVMRVSRDSSVD
jgi:hypothetical protein